MSIEEEGTTVKWKFNYRWKSVAWGQRASDMMESNFLPNRARQKEEEA